MTVSENMGENKVGVGGIKNELQLLEFERKRKFFDYGRHKNKFNKG